MTEMHCRKLVAALGAHDSYFTLRLNAARPTGISPELEIAAAIRQLAQSKAADGIDECSQMAKVTAAECLVHFWGSSIKAKKSYL